MLKNLPINRIILYALLIGLFPFLCVAFLFYSKNNELNAIQETIQTIQNQAALKEKKQAMNLAVRQHFREADHFYIDKYLETLIFLEPEIEMLQKVARDKNFADDERIKKRIEFLTGSANSMAFSEGVVQTYPLFQETTETLVHPIEVNAADIVKILSRIEGSEGDPSVPINTRPQLIITEFKLDKKKVSDKNEVFLLNLKLIKREFL